MEHYEAYFMRTPLYEEHLSLGAKMVDFFGWEMPLQYRGILEEHQAVRTHSGIFDVSHMGRIEISGEDAERFCDYIFTNAIAGKKEGKAIYGVLCREDGTAIDDAIILHHSSKKCSLIANASNRQRVFSHLVQLSGGWSVSITPAYEREGILAVQGPEALGIVNKIFPESVSLNTMDCLESSDYILSRTGYTGEQGIEIFAPKEKIVRFWRAFIAEGTLPIGLGARDTLRLEKGYALYGHELSDSIAPTESVSAWSVKLNKCMFLGKEALSDLERSPKKRCQYGIVLLDPGIARSDYTVTKNGETIGRVTSGTYSPSLKKSIAIVMVDRKLENGDEVEVIVRDHPCRAKVVPFPFL